jgi:hypothetical protein
MSKSVSCPYSIKTCKCWDCARNAKYSDCKKGYCIDCFECEHNKAAVHNIYACTAYERRTENETSN